MTLNKEQLREEFYQRFAVFGIVDLEAIGEDNILDYFLSLIQSRDEEILKEMERTRIKPLFLDPQEDTSFEKINAVDRRNDEAERFNAGLSAGMEVLKAKALK